MLMVAKYSLEQSHFLYVTLCFPYLFSVIYCVTGLVQCFFMPILMSIHSDGHSPTNHTLYRTVSGHSFYIFCIEYIWCHNRENVLEMKVQVT